MSTTLAGPSSASQHQAGTVTSLPPTRSVSPGRSGCGQIVGFRAGWGLGNALFIATSLAVSVGSARRVDRAARRCR